MGCNHHAPAPVLTKHTVEKTLRSVARDVRPKALCMPALLGLTRGAGGRGLGGPHDCGHYNAAAWETGFFVSQGGSWDSEYGRFFLGWYSGALLAHGDRVLAAAAEALGRRGRPRRARAVTEVPPASGEQTPPRGL